LTESRRLSFQEVADQIRGLINGKHGYVYPAMVAGNDRRCRLWHPETDSPGCIIGVWGHSLGLRAQDLTSCENQGASTVMDLLEEYGFRFEDKVRTAQFLQDLQTAQDMGATWGWAFDNAWELRRMKDLIDMQNKNLTEVTDKYLYLDALVNGDKK
jgi:hypothetical protein